MLLRNPLRARIGRDGKPDVTGLPALCYLVPSREGMMARDGLNPGIEETLRLRSCKRLLELGTQRIFHGRFCQDWNESAGTPVRSGGVGMSVGDFEGFRDAFSENRLFE